MGPGGQTKELEDSEGVRNKEAEGHLVQRYKVLRKEKSLAYLKN